MEDQCKKEQRDDKCIPLIATKLGNYDHMQGLCQRGKALALSSCYSPTVLI